MKKLAPKQFLLLTVLAAMFAAAPALAQSRDTQAAVAAGLEWLAAQQIKEGPEAGSWDTPRAQYRPAVTSLAGLAFLANGYLPGDERYGYVVQRAMDYVIGTMRADGYLGMDDRSGMYIHAISTLFGLSYLGASENPERETALAKWCRRALDVVVEAQQVRRAAIDAGGWRYTPSTSESDVSVTCWQLLVLHAARQCGYVIDPAVFDAGLDYVNRAFQMISDANAPDAVGGILYRPGVSRAPAPAVTGMAVFIKQIMERDPEDQRIAAALRYLERYPPAWGGEQFAGYFYFTLFYMTQGMFQVGEHYWQSYHEAVNNILLERQSGSGSWPYPPDNTVQSRLTGDAYPAAMAALILSINRQYLPVFQRQRALF